MPAQREAALEYVRAHRQDFLKALQDFLRFPSVSTAAEHKQDMVDAAEWLADYLRSLGATRVGLHHTEGHPVVYGELMHAGAEAPTLLVYGHYDVQPPDPLDLWDSPPFEPAIRGDRLYARGAADMKGQIIGLLAAVEALVRTGDLPVNLKFMFEGEEEIGSPHLADYISRNKALLAADVSLNADAGIMGEDLPSITYGLRGLAYFELHVQGAAHDLHSGVYGGVVHNAAQALAELIATMHDAQGHITVEGFYDQVRPLDPEERAELQRLPLDDRFYLERTGAPALWGEPEYTPVERVSARPTLEVNGISGGFTQPGVKTVIPSRAFAKISCRLVPDQEPEAIYECLRRHLEKHAPPTIRWELKYIVGAKPAIIDRKSRWVQALADAMRTVWGKDPLYKREGGTVPVVAQVKDILGIDSVMVGFILPDADLHAPNENLHLPTWYRGMETYVHYLCNLAG